MFETLRSVLHSGKISHRIQYMIEVLFAIRKDKFKVMNLVALACFVFQRCRLFVRDTLYYMYV